MFQVRKTNQSRDAPETLNQRLEAIDTLFGVFSVFSVAEKWILNIGNTHDSAGHPREWLKYRMNPADQPAKASVPTGWSQRAIYSWN